MDGAAETRMQSPLGALPIRPREEGVEVSVLVPVCERPEPLAELYREYAAPLRAAGMAFEFLFVAQPPFSELAAALAPMAAEGEPLRILQVGQGVGEATLLKLAAGQARGRVLVTLPAYRRVEADYLPALVRRVEDGTDLAVARRWPRRDSWINRLQNRAFHLLIRRLGGGRIHDTACGVRAMRPEVLEETPLHGDFFRFLPLLAIREGYRVEEVPCPQHPEDVRARVYSPATYLRRLIDAFGIFFLLRFVEKPLRFFGLVGGGISLAGVATLAVVLVQRLGGEPAADRPLLLLGVLLLVLGVQAVALGLVGEIIVHWSVPRRRSYRLAHEPFDDPE